jgi:hypothetical protein
VQDLTPEDHQYKKAQELLTVYQTELFIALKGVFNKLSYPLIDDEGETALVSTSLLDGYVDEKTGHHIKYRNEEASKGEFVVEVTLRDANKFQVFLPAPSDDKMKSLPAATQSRGSLLVSAHGPHDVGTNQRRRRFPRSHDLDGAGDLGASA